MKTLALQLIIFIALGNGNPGADSFESKHTATSGSLNNARLDQIETLIRKKSGAEFNKNSNNTFVLNGYNVYTEVINKRFSPSIYEESFYDVKNPDKIYRMRIMHYPNGDRELAVMIHGDEGSVNYHAFFDMEGNMLEEDPWGNDEGYTIKTFELYYQYRNIFSNKVDAK